LRTENITNVTNLHIFSRLRTTVEINQDLHLQRYSIMLTFDTSHMFRETTISLFIDV